MAAKSPPTRRDPGADGRRNNIDITNLLICWFDNLSSIQPQSRCPIVALHRIRRKSWNLQTIPQFNSACHRIFMRTTHQISLSAHIVVSTQSIQFLIARTGDCPTLRFGPRFRSQRETRYAVTFFGR